MLSYLFIFLMGLSPLQNHDQENLISTDTMQNGIEILETKEDYSTTPLPDENPKIFRYISSYGNNIDPDVIALRRALVKHERRLCTNPSYLTSLIGKESSFRNIRSHSESDVFGFVQMKVGTIQYLKKLYPDDLPLIRDGKEFLQNVEAQVLYADCYFQHIIEIKNLNFEKHISLLTKIYNGGPGKYYASPPSYYEKIVADYETLI